MIFELALIWLSFMPFLRLYTSHGYSSLRSGLREAALSAGLHWRFAMSHSPKRAVLLLRIEGL